MAEPTGLFNRSAGRRAIAGRDESSWWDPGSEQYLERSVSQAAARLFEMLLRVARGEAYRRRGQLRISGPELDDLAHQDTADAVVAIIGKICQSRGESLSLPGRTSSPSSRYPARPGGTSGATRPARWTPRTGRGCRIDSACPGPRIRAARSSPRSAGRGRAGADPASAPGLRRHRAAPGAAGRPGRRAEFEPQRDL